MLLKVIQNFRQDISFVHFLFLQGHVVLMVLSLCGLWSFDFDNLNKLTVDCRLAVELESRCAHRLYTHGCAVECGSQTTQLETLN